MQACWLQGICQNHLRTTSPQGTAAFAAQGVRVSGGDLKAQNALKRRPSRQAESAALAEGHDAAFEAKPFSSADRGRGASERITLTRECRKCALSFRKRFCSGSAPRQTGIVNLELVL